MIVRRLIVLCALFATTTWTVGCTAIGIDDAGAEWATDADTSLPMQDTGTADDGDVVDPATGGNTDTLLARSSDDDLFEGSAAAPPACVPYDIVLCGDPVCAGLRSCCVGDGACCAPVQRPALSDAFSITECAEGAEVSGCAPGVDDLRASATSTFRDGGIVPGGDESAPGGLISPERVDLRFHRLRLSARFEPPVNCEGDCVESVSLGVTEQSEIPGAVRSVAAITYSGTRERVAISVGDTPVHYVEEVTTSSNWSIDFRPNGIVAVERDGAPVIEVPYRPRPSVRVIVWGRTLNPSAGETPTRIADVSAEVSLCDVPTEWPDRAPLALSLGGGGVIAADDGAQAPTLLRRPSGDVIAFGRDGAIDFAYADGRGGWEVRPGILTTDNAPAFMAAWIGDPELVETRDGTRLFFSAEDAMGVRSIGVAALGDELGVEGEPAQALAPSAVEATSVSQPTVARHESGELVMIALAEYTVDTRSLVIARDRATGSFGGYESISLSALSKRGPRQTGTGFDRDAISHPSLVIHNGAWKLHFTGRRGTRSAVGLLLSDDLLHWRDFGEVLSAGTAPFERMGVGAADVAVAENGLTVVYEGTDGVYPTLASATRLASDNGTF